MLRLIWEPEARQQFLAVIDYIAARNPVAATRMERMIAAGLERLRKFPYSGRPGRAPGTRELIVHPNYLVIYQVTDDAIDVLRVLHARQRYP